MNSPFCYDDYDKISDDLMVIGYNTIVRFNVILSKALKDGRRFHFHQEYEYKSNKYTNVDKLVTLRRRFDFYISIENIKSENGIKEFIQIRMKDILYLRARLDEIYRWFIDLSSDIFAYNKNNELMLYKKVNPVIIELSLNKYLKIEPVVVRYSTGDTMGVRMFLSSDNNYVDVDVDRLMGFIYLINTINMYESAQLMINYIQRPEYGYNRTDFENYNNTVEAQEVEGFTENKNNNVKRVIESKNKQKSFFDKIDGLK